MSKMQRINCGSLPVFSRKAPGRRLASLRTFSSPSMILLEMTSFHGQTLFSEQTMNHASKAMVIS